MSNNIVEKVLIQAIVAASITWITGFCSINQKSVVNLSSIFTNADYHFTSEVHHRTATLKWSVETGDQSIYQVLRHREGFEHDSKTIATINPANVAMHEHEIVFTDNVNSFGAYRYEIVKLNGQAKDVIVNQIVLFEQMPMQ